MPTASIWPTFAAHEAVTCGICGGPTDHTQDAGYAPGHGQFRRACTRGHSWTYYDLSPESR